MCHTCCTQTSFRYCTTAALRVHTSTCREKNPATAWKHLVLSLTYNRKDQQDAADNDGDNDRGFSSPKVQHGNCVVELSNLDLRRERRRQEKQELSSRLPKAGSREGHGAAPSRASPRDSERAGTASQARRAGGRAVPVTARPWALSREPSSLPGLRGMPRPHPAGCDAAVVPLPAPAQGTELQVPWPHCTCPRRDSPFLESPWHCTRLPVLLLLENHFHSSSAFLWL